MKQKTWVKYLFVLLMAAGTGCKKQAENTSKSSAANPIYKIQDGRVAFTSATAYTQFLETATSEEKAALADEIQRQPGYTPLSKSATAKQTLLRGNKAERLVLTGNAAIDDEVNDILSSPLLANMINSDGIVQIGDYVYNADLVTEKCYALHASWLSGTGSAYYYNLLYNGNANNLYVFEFSTDDDVVQVLQDNGNPTVKATNATTLGERCGDGRARRLKDDGTEYLPGYNPPDDVLCKVVYQKAGFYFALFGKIKYTSGWSGHDWQHLQSYYEWQFKPRCWGERVQPHVKDIIPGDGSQYKKYAWESSRGLAKYKIQFQWYLIGDPVYTYSAPHLTRVYGIQAGY